MITLSQFTGVAFLVLVILYIYVRTLSYAYFKSKEEMFNKELQDILKLIKNKK